MRIVASAFAGLVLSFALAGQARAAIVIDGLLDALYGASTASVTYDANAPTSNFNGGPSNHLTAYDIYLRSEAGNVFGFLKNLGPDNPSSQPFANLYWDLNPSTGSDLGFEITNNRAFIPGQSGYSAPLALQYALGADGFEFRIPSSYFINGIPSLGSNTVAEGGTIQLRLSQALGYSVAGGESFGADRLGEISVSSAVPELSTWAMMLLGFAGLGFMAYRRSRRAMVLAKA